jgi:non-ribosomal peptide synthetase component E (peptide arylation enzyme)
MRPFLTLHDPSRAAVYYDAGLWTRDTFYSLLSEWAERWPTQAALRDGRQNLNIGKAAAFGVPDERLGERVCLAIMGDLTGERVSSILPPKICQNMTCLSGSSLSRHSR